MKRRAGLLASAWLLFVPLTGTAGEPAASHIVIGGKEEAVILDAGGTPVSTLQEQDDIRAIAIDDRRNAVWIVDKGGVLNRYGMDGALQLNVPVDAAGPKAVLAVDPVDGGLWYLNRTTLLKLDVNGGTIAEIELADEASALAFDWKRRRLWVGVNEQLRAFDENGQRIRSLSAPADIRALAFDDRSGVIWVGLEEKVLGFDPDGEPVGAFAVDRLEHLAVARDSSLWVVHTKTAFRFDADGTLLQEIDLEKKEPPVEGLAYDPNTDRLWLARKHSLGMLGASGADAEILDGLNDVRSVAANGDITPPVAELGSPTADSLVPPRPTIHIIYSDVGLGVDVDAITLQVGGADTAVTCTVSGDGADCVPDEALTDYYPELGITVRDHAGNASAMVNVQYRLDTDGDGVEDYKDTYPDDPTRYRLAAVSGISASLEFDADTTPPQDKAHVTWDAHADPDKTAGYLVYRKAYGDDAPIALTTDAITALEYPDITVQNGTGYTYHIVAVDERGNEGDPGEGVDLFAAWNHAKADGLTVQREFAAGRIEWQQADGLRHRIYRADGESDEYAVVHDAAVTETTWLDETTRWDLLYRYRIATLRDFTDVFTGQPVVVEGPSSDVAELPPLPPLAVQLNDAARGDDGMPEILIRQDDMGIAGSYSEARGPVDIIASDGNGHDVNATSDPQVDGNGFRLVLPAMADAVWTVTVSERLIPDRSASTQFRFIADTAPPELAFVDGLATETEDEFLQLEGTAIDRLTGIAKLSAVSDRYGPQAFGLVQGEGGRFSGEVPLEYGENNITVTAIDGVGNQAGITHAVTRKPPLAPTIQLLAPHDGLVTTESRVSVSGRVYTGLERDKVRIVLGGNVQFPQEGSSTEGYPFSFEGVALREGYNLISVSVETPAGNATASAVVNYEAEPPPPAEPVAPELTLENDSLDITTNGDSIAIGGSVSGDGELSVTVNGETVDIVGDSFQYIADLGECIDGTAEYTITVTDGNGLSSTQTLTVNCDRAAPVINIASPSALAAPAVTTLPGNPVRFQGSVSDASLGGLTINGSPVALEPGAEAGQYGFDTSVLLPTGAATPVSVEAWDAAGNTASRNYVLQVASQVGIEIVAPIEAAEYLVEGDNASLSVTARLSNFDPAQHQAYASLGTAAPVPMGISANVANASLPLPAVSGRQDVTVEVRDANGNTLASRSVGIDVTGAADVPLEVVRTEPANNAAGIAPIDPITIYFNKSIDPAKLDVSVKQTVHGKDYDYRTQNNSGFGDLKTPPLIEIHKDMEPVEGGLAVTPDNRAVSFHPEKRFVYDATAYVDVTYDGDSLARLNYRVRPLPTIIAGTAVDEFGTPLPGVAVKLQEYDLEVTSDHLGNFAIGAELDPPLSAGRFTLTANPSLRNPSFGVVNRNIQVQYQRLNVVSALRLPLLDADVPFAQLSGEKETVVLAGGNLKLDLSEARLVFPDGRNSGAAHVQFRPRSRLSVRVHEAVSPHWLYGVQPSGITVEGKVGFEIDMPPLFGSLDYIPEDGTRVLILAYDASRGVVQAVGVGEVNSGTVRSLDDISIQRLDYLGYAFVREARQEILERYLEGEINSLDALMQELQR